MASSDMVLLCDQSNGTAAFAMTASSVLRFGAANAASSNRNPSDAATSGQVPAGARTD